MLEDFRLLGRFYLVHWYHLFVPKEYHTFFIYARWDAVQKKHIVFVQPTDLHDMETRPIDIYFYICYSD